MTISSTLKYIFLIYFILCLIFGIVYFAAPEYITTATAWPFLDPVAGRVMGSMFFGYAFGALFCYRATEWSEVKIMVLANIVWCILATVAMAWMMAIHATIPLLVGGLYLVLPLIFFILFLWQFNAHN